MASVAEKGNSVEKVFSSRNVLYLYERENIIVTEYEFIFSEKRKRKLIRHLVFWIVYCTYFYVQSISAGKFDEFFTRKPYYTALMSLCCFAPVFIFTVYFFIYFLLPRTLQKKKYLLFLFAFLMTYIFGTFINYFTAELFLYYTGHFEITMQHRLEMSNYNTRWGMIIAIVAVGIKLSKNWYLQQEENLEIVRKKTRSVMQLQKSRIHPELLFRSLSTIYTNIQSGSDEAASMILKLSDLLSYSLYESDMKWILLQKELTELDNLISLEKHNKESLIEIKMQLDGEINYQLIAPMTIVKLVEESITLLRTMQTEYCLLHLLITAEGKELSLHLSFIDLDKKSSANVKWLSFIENTRSRLREYYSKHDYQIHLTEKENKTTIQVNLKVPDNMNTINPASHTKLSIAAHDTV